MTITIYKQFNEEKIINAQVSKGSVGLDSEKRLFSRKDAKRGKMMRKEEKEGNERGKRYIQDIYVDEENMEYQNKKEDSVLTLYVNLVILGVFCIDRP